MVKTNFDGNNYNLNLSAVLERLNRIEQKASMLEKKVLKLELLSSFQIKYKGKDNDKWFRL